MISVQREDEGALEWWLIFNYAIGGAGNMLWFKRNCWNLYRHDLFQLARNRIRIGIGTIA